MKWQPIETAPKDGAKILVWQGKKVHFAYWDNQQYNKKPRPFWNGTCAGIWGVAGARHSPPTHWMPLPDAPEDA